MWAARIGRWQAPYHHFYEGIFGNRMPLFVHQFSVHVGEDNNTSGLLSKIAQLIGGDSIELGAEIHFTSRDKIDTHELMKL
ncbi:MAG: hypothetical protein WCA08_20155 [Desulfoferrobacter sp.]